MLNKQKVKLIANQKNNDSSPPKSPLNYGHLFFDTVICLVLVFTKKTEHTKNTYFSDYKNNLCPCKICITQIHNGKRKCFIISPSEVIATINLPCIPL